MWSVLFRCKYVSEDCYRLLDLTGPLQIGGLPKLQTHFQIQTRDFDGCIKDFYVDNELLDLNKSVANVGTSPGCDQRKHSCIGNPCKNGGQLTLHSIQNNNSPLKMLPATKLLTFIQFIIVKQD